MMRSVTAFFLVGLCIALCAVPVLYSSVFMAVLMLLILTTEWPRIARSQKKIWLLTPLYPVLPCIILIALNQNTHYRSLLALAVVLASVHDTGSYIAGNLFGRHHIAPSISPLKTWEGFFGGVISTMLVFMMILYVRGYSMPWHMFLFFSCGFSVMAFYGDLFESWLKRKAGIKDSGTLLPGHGGILDRVDSTLFVATYIYFFKDYLSTILA